ncbi:hypothetical protein TVAG_156030 [Trichomonas vaginalis G3]|uniref:Nucleotide-diphospho-sugar transferase domain-containing protein n=1 Tax=Trichomonas vaginalis (strain ATCC PRA-98 / G3) TaxID=412133 RepID=A2FPC6_TRIV3|nr:hypothetical protein TVAGG3_0497890 [Trichomonas vaginalis G3]EAX93239.1 hypothetical protein TVAG_156030 [Trichomonas vaginalis G3]KAI5516855.1 hypothetical protein TVAGG3_0497890 [Trichomonas vaginalis G3]|eukprot:XP_001306169.1 hypothetical protein [Trichomonas vaginalis G3]
MFKSWEDEAKKVFGDIDFLYNENIVNDTKNAAKQNNCKLCNITRIDENSDSTSDDLVIGFLFNRFYVNVLTFVRTLRSSNGKCGILFFCDRDYIEHINPRELEELTNCGVRWLVAPKIDTNLIKEPNLIRRLIEFLFLKQYKDHFNRILILDVADSIFQKDPFSKNLPKNKLVFSIEKVQFMNHDWAMNRMKKTDYRNFDQHFWEFKFIINGGLIYGPIKDVYNFYVQMMRPSLVFQPFCCDQSIMAMTYYYGLYTNVFIDYKSTNFISAAYSAFEEMPRKDTYIHEIQSKNAPAVIHQYDRICQVSRYLKDYCPAIGSFQTLPYGRENYFMQLCGNNFSRNNPPIFRPPNLPVFYISIAIITSTTTIVLLCMFQLIQSVFMKRLNKKIFHSVQIPN